MKRIAEALYIVNKTAKFYRDMAIDLKKYLFEQKIPSERLKEYLFNKIEGIDEISLEYGEYTLENSYCQTFTISNIKESIRNLSRDDCDGDLTEEEVEENYENELDELETIETELKRINNLLHDELSSLRKDKIALYELKDNVIKKINPEIIEYNKINTIRKELFLEDVDDYYIDFVNRPMVMGVVEIGGIKFHTTPTDEIPEGLNLAELETLDIVSSEIKFDIDMSLNDAIIVLMEFLREI